MTRKIFLKLLGILTVSALISCSSAYYATMEKFGYHKRDILVSRVQEAKESQAKTKEQFSSALEQFNSVLGFHGGKLQDKYEALDREYQASESSANNLRKRINDVENVAEALFDEWDNELNQYKNARLRSSSEEKLRATRRKYQPMMQAMRRAEKKIDPVLGAFRDQVLFLKHNLNAQAVASLKDELRSVESDIAALIREMEASIREADSFINAMSNA